MWFLNNKCAIDEEERNWINEVFVWLINEFGIDTIHETLMVEPTAEFFPERFSHDERDIRRLFETVCEYMETDAARFELDLIPDESGWIRNRVPTSAEHSGAAGFYWSENQRLRVVVKLSEDSSIEDLTATLAHEIAHGILIGSGRVGHDDDEGEPLADLLPVIFGLGIFGANVSFKFSQFSSAGMQGWSASRQGYLTEEIWGYALALFAYLRSERSPDWKKHLQTNVAYFLTGSLRWLQANGAGALDRYRRS